MDYVRNRGWLWVAPAILGVTLLVIAPVLYNVSLSFQNKVFLGGSPRFVGAENYLQLLGDSEFRRSVVNTLVFATASVALQLLLGVALALALNKHFLGKDFLRSLVIAPYVLPTVIAVLVWKWLLHDSYGLLSYVLSRLGILSSHFVWLSPEHAMLTLVLISVWKFFPFTTIIVLARLQTIPSSLYESADVDGASPLVQFLSITLPQLKVTLLVLILLRAIFMFTKFDIVWLLSEGSGGVGRTVKNIPVYAYLKTFESLQISLGSSAVVYAFLVLVLGSVLYMTVFRGSLVR